MPPATTSARGSISVEWVGVLVVVGLVVGALLAMSGVAGQRAAAKVDATVCAVVGVHCPPPVALAGEDPATTTPSHLERRAEGAAPQVQTFGATGSGGPAAIDDPPPLTLPRDEARDRFGYGDRSRCRETGGPNREAYCLGPDGVLRVCSVGSSRLISCYSALEEPGLRAQASCGLAPNGLDAPEPGELLCRLTTRDGSTAIVRCAPGELAGTTSGEPGGTVMLRRCRDTNLDDLGRLEPDLARVRCGPNLEAVRADDERGQPIWRWLRYCSSPEGDGFACETRRPRQPGKDDGWRPVPPPGPPDACGSRTLPPELIRTCRVLPEAPLQDCTLYDDSHATCLVLDGTTQHCTSPADPCSGPNRLSRTGRRSLAIPSRADREAAARRELGDRLNSEPLLLPMFAGCARRGQRRAIPELVGPYAAFRRARVIGQLMGPSGAPALTWVDGEVVESVGGSSSTYPTLLARIMATYLRAFPRGASIPPLVILTAAGSEDMAPKLIDGTIVVGVAAAQEPGAFAAIAAAAPLEATIDRHYRASVPVPDRVALPPLVVVGGDRARVPAEPEDGQVVVGARHADDARAYRHLALLRELVDTQRGLPPGAYLELSLLPHGTPPALATPPPYTPADVPHTPQFAIVDAILSRAVDAHGRLIFVGLSPAVRAELARLLAARGYAHFEPDGPELVELVLAVLEQLDAQVDRERTRQALAVAYDAPTATCRADSGPRPTPPPGGGGGPGGGSGVLAWLGRLCNGASVRP